MAYADREKQNAYMRAYYHAHYIPRPPRPAMTAEESAERNRIKAREWYAAHRAEFGPRMCDYMREHKDQQYRRKGAALCDHPDCLSIGPVVLALQVNAHRCYLCGVALSPSIRKGEPGHMQVDHVVPRSRGGLHCVENIRLACEPCNQWKGASLLPDLDARLTLGLA
jgi:5-methylcytosine-specific restriction endonuclease McrA